MLLPRLLPSLATVTTVMATGTATAMATMADMVTITARGLLRPRLLPRLLLSPAMATTATATVTDTAMATMADMVTITARGLLSPVMAMVMVMAIMVRRFTFFSLAIYKIVSRVQLLKRFIKSSQFVLFDAVLLNEIKGCYKLK